MGEDTLERREQLAEQPKDATLQDYTVNSLLFVTRCPYLYRTTGGTAIAIPPVDYIYSLRNVDSYDSLGVADYEADVFPDCEDVSELIAILQGLDRDVGANGEDSEVVRRGKHVDFGARDNDVLENFDAPDASDAASLKSLILEVRCEDTKSTVTDRCGVKQH